MSIYIIPVMLFLILCYAIVKRLPAYDYFIDGAKSSINLCIKTFPFLVAIFIMIELFSNSGVLNFVISQTNFIWKLIGIPKEVVELIFLRPFTGSGSLGVLTKIYTLYGTDSYISNCASVIIGTSDTLFYIIALYFGTVKIKKTGAIIPISLISCLIGNIIACLICKLI